MPPCEARTDQLNAFGQSERFPMLRLAGQTDILPSGLSRWSDIDLSSPQHTVPLPDLLTSSFICRHTRFTSVDELLHAGQLNAKWMDGTDARIGSIWDQFIRSVSDYHDWDAMVREAGAEWIMRRIGIVIDA